MINFWTHLNVADLVQHVPLGLVRESCQCTCRLVLELGDLIQLWKYSASLCVF